MAGTNTITQLLKMLILDPSLISPSDIRQILTTIMSSSPDSSAVTTNQITTFLVALKLTNKDSDPAVIAECVDVLRSCSVQVDVEGLKAKGVKIVDIVGTGGDGHDTFNVSTTAGIVAAAAGCVVAKHGNRASSSSCGSADILEALDIPISSISPSQIPSLLSSTNFCFLFAQRYHPAMKIVARERKELAIPTIFNLLGPLSNPVRPDGAVIGVYKKELGMLVAQSLQLLGIEKALVVCGHEGLDELSPAGPSHVWSLSSNTITAITLHPTHDFGLPLHSLSDVRGGDKVQNASILMSLLHNELPDGHPILDYVLLNTAALCVLAGVAKDWKDGVRVARDVIKSGRALKVLLKFREEVGNILK